MNPVTFVQKEKNVLKRNPLFGLIGLAIILALVIPLLNKAATAAETKANVERAFAADAARYQAMADFNRVDNRSEALRYQALADLYTNAQRAFEADAARYKAMADFYSNKNEADAARYQGLADLYANTQRAIEADAARYTALANFYRVENEAESARYQGLANLYANTQRAIEADAARYTALANFYRAGNEADAARYQGLADLYANTQQAIEAYAARYIALAASYLNKNEVESSRDQWLAGLHLPRSETALSAFLADNPDLMMAHRYPSAGREIVKANPIRNSAITDLFLAKNDVVKPEVESSREQWLAGLRLPRSETALSAFLADNLDLMMAHRYPTTGREVVEANPTHNSAINDLFLAKNDVKKPETSREQWLAGLHLPRSETALSAFLADNPDLMMAHRYPSAGREIDDTPYTALVAFYPNEDHFNSEFFAANPELMVAGQYLVKTNTNLPANNRTWDRWFYPGH